MISISERMLQKRVNELNNELFDMRLQNQRLRKYIDLLENKLSNQETDLVILTNQINYFLRYNKQKKKH